MKVKSLVRYFCPPSLSARQQSLDRRPRLTCCMEEEEEEEEAVLELKVSTELWLDGREDGRWSCLQ